MKKFFLAIGIAIGMTACSSTPKADELTMIVGTYTFAGSEGIYTYKFDQNNGEAKPLEVIKMDNPSYLTLSANQQVMYVVSEKSDETASVAAFKFDKENGKAELINRQPTYGEDPCYVATNGKIVTTANYSGGSMSILPLRYDGGLEPVDTVFCGNIGGPDMSRQDAPHVHCTVFSPDGKQLLATDFSADRILQFDVEADPTKPHLLMENTPIDNNSGPRHIIFSPDGRFVYIISELSEAVTVCSYNEGKMQVIQTIETHPQADRHAADIHLSPDGKFLYASVRNIDDGLAIFEVNQQTGMLKKVGYQPTGKHPRNFNITPNGKYVLVADMNDNKIEIFERNMQTGLLTNTHRDINLSMPVCIVFAY
ncbi:MAG: lactonase family protein [Bacteroidaceae bacterium]|nr:lactonase family protein [Bacteroidaceae bacterium]